jgi:hypothetical protein
LTSRRHFLFAHGHGTNNGLEFGLVDTGLEPTDHISKRFEVGLVTYQLHGIQESRHHANIRKRNLISNQVRLVQQMIIDNCQGSRKISLGLLVTEFIPTKPKKTPPQEIIDKPLIVKVKKASPETIKSVRIYIPRI